MSSLTQMNPGATLTKRSKVSARNTLGRTGGRVMTDTGWGGYRKILVGLFAAPFLALALFAGEGSADPATLNAKVVWSHGGRVYIASNESLPIQKGDLLTFYSDKKLVASGTVSDVVEGTLAIGRVTSGSLDPVKKLDRLRVLAERPHLRPVNALRIGIPSRTNQLFACATPSVRSPLPRAGFRGEALSVRSFQLTRDISDAGTAVWPDTLFIRLFDEETDEEIALERGEVDAAVFWPGELSTHMREDPKWRDFSYGTRARGFVVTTAPHDGPRVSSADSTALLSMNDEAFRGDLALWDGPTGSPVAEPKRADIKTSRRFEVNHSSPGWQALERLLNGGKPSLPVDGEPPALRVSYTGTSVVSPDEGGVIFAIRCPVLCAPDLRSYMRALGPDALANMVDCAIAGGRR